MLLSRRFQVRTYDRSSPRGSANSSPQYITLYATTVALLHFAALRIYHHASFACIAGQVRFFKKFSPLLRSACQVLQTSLLLCNLSSATDYHLAPDNRDNGLRTDCHIRTKGGMCVR